MTAQDIQDTRDLKTKVLDYISDWIDYLNANARAMGADDISAGEDYLAQKAGEEVEGIDAPPYQGGECEYFFKVYVATRKRKNGVECAHKHSD